MQREHGYLLNADGNEIASTHQCCHCGMHFEIVKGSGVQRGVCLKCMGVVCGKRECVAGCVPIERQLELMERG